MRFNVLVANLQVASLLLSYAGVTAEIIYKVLRESVCR
jgi:hypothetical protein